MVKYWKHITFTGILGGLAVVVALFTNVYKAVQAVTEKPQPATVINNYYNKDVKDIQYASLINIPKVESHNSMGNGIAGRVTKQEDLSKAQTTKRNN